MEEIVGGCLAGTLPHSQCDDLPQLHHELLRHDLARVEKHKQRTGVGDSGEGAMGLCPDLDEHHPHGARFETGPDPVEFSEGEQIAVGRSAMLLHRVFHVLLGKDREGCVGNVTVE